MKRTSCYPRPAVDGKGRAVAAHAGGTLLLRTAAAVGLDRELSVGPGRWRRPTARHDPGKMLLDLAVSLALGGDCLADVSQLRAQPGVFGPVASDPTVSRLIATLAADTPAALAAIGRARAAARSRAWTVAGEQAPGHARDAEHPLVLDVDATLVTAHSEKERAAPTFKGGFGFHPLGVFADHGPAGSLVTTPMQQRGVWKVVDLTAGGRWRRGRLHSCDPADLDENKGATGNGPLAVEGRICSVSAHFCPQAAPRRNFRRRLALPATS